MARSATFCQLPAASSSLGHSQLAPQATTLGQALASPEAPRQRNAPGLIGWGLCCGFLSLAADDADQVGAGLGEVGDLLPIAGGQQFLGAEPAAPAGHYVGLGQVLSQVGGGDAPGGMNFTWR